MGWGWGVGRGLLCSIHQDPELLKGRAPWGAEVLGVVVQKEAGGRGGAGQGSGWKMLF